MKKAYFLFAAYLPKKAYFLFAAYFHEEGLLFICHNDHDLAGSSSRPGASDYISTLVRSTLFSCCVNQWDCLLESTGHAYGNLTLIGCGPVLLVRWVMIGISWKHSLKFEHCHVSASGTQKHIN